MVQFKSLDDCVKHIRKKYPENKENPKFLYRGEAGCFQNTYSSYERLFRSNQYNSEELHYLQDIVIHVSENMNREFVSSDPKGNSLDNKNLGSLTNVSGLIQHYGFPTRLVDLTSSLDIATYFAFGADHRNKPDLLVGEKGKLGIINIATLTNENVVFDLKMSEAKRPKRQFAYALLLQESEDLKNPDFGVKWFDFTLIQSDIPLYNRRDLSVNLLSTHYDKIGHRICYHFCKYVLKNRYIHKFEKLMEFLYLKISNLVHPAYPTLVGDDFPDFCEIVVRNFPVLIDNLDTPPQVVKRKYVDSWTTVSNKFVKIGMKVKCIDYKIDSGMIIEKKGTIEKIDNSKR